MRLLNTSTFQLRCITEDEPTPAYAALSHCWGAEEVVYDDLQCSRNWTEKCGFRKLLGACQEAMRSHKLDWLWADTVCIDRSSSAELSESINSVYRWYRNCSICLAYLDDICTSELPDDILEKSRWMQRSWTLVELIAPRKLEFYNADWSLLGTKESFISTLSRVTLIDQTVLGDAEALGDISIGKRMSWAAQRSARRVEDLAYSLLGIFGVSMEIRYGEKALAFMRLQEELLRTLNDASLFAWKSLDTQEYRGLLARSPSEFGHFKEFHLQEHDTTRWRLPTALRLTFTAPTLTCGLAPNGPEEDELSMPLTQVPAMGTLGIKFRMWKGELVRWKPQHFFYVPISVPSITQDVPVARDVDTRSSRLICQVMTNEPQRQLLPIFNPQSMGSRLNEHDLLCFQPIETKTDYCFRFRGYETESERTGPAMSATAQSSTGINLTQGHSSRFTAGTEETSVATPKGNKVSDRASSEDEESVESDDYENYLFSPALETQPTELHPLFAELVHELAEVALDRFRSWVTGYSASCKRTQSLEAPSGCKRIKADDFLEHINIESRELPEEEDTVILDAPRSRAFACPFYLLDREYHFRCLTRADLQTIRDLKKHLWVAHRQPYYCPTCGITFARAATRDEHIKTRTCSQQTWKGPPEGLSEGQLQQLARRCRSGVSEVDQWAGIWHLIFPETNDMRSPPKLPRTPYLAGNVEFAVCVVRGYWSREGQKIIAEFLKQRNLRDYDVPDEERNLSALYQITLDNMIDQLVQALQHKDLFHGVELISSFSNALSSLRKFCSKLM